MALVSLSERRRRQRHVSMPDHERIRCAGQGKPSAATTSTTWPRLSRRQPWQLAALCSATPGERWPSPCPHGYGQNDPERRAEHGALPAGRRRNLPAVNCGEPPPPGSVHVPRVPRSVIGRGMGTWALPGQYRRPLDRRHSPSLASRAPHHPGAPSPAGTCIV